jgi:hypothetical protein
MKANVEVAHRTPRFLSIEKSPWSADHSFEQCMSDSHMIGAISGKTVAAMLRIKVFTASAELL